MPTLVSSNINAPAFLIGERCADFLRREAGANITPEVLQAEAAQP
jgi:choline dehydrogenase-like flavoprotein